MGFSRRSPFVVLALGVTAMVATAGLYRTAQAGEQAAVPELPGVEERFEGLYDEDGCLRTGEDDRDCSVTAEEIDEVLAGNSVDDVRHLAGFTGSHWTDQPAAGRPVVLEDTVDVSIDADLELSGLVRNETSETVSVIEVSATVRDGRGEVISVLTGPAGVGTVRSGEPVPFVLSGPAPAAAVARVEWSATILDAPLVGRDLEWQSYWEQPGGRRDPVENHLYREVGPGPHPNVVFGSVRNIGSAPAADVAVVIAWLDDGGRIAAIGRSTALDPAGGPVPSLSAGSAADVLVVNAEVPLGAEALTWVSAS
jgi:hypothetical protein